MSPLPTEYDLIVLMAGCRYYSLGCRLFLGLAACGLARVSHAANNCSPYASAGSRTHVGVTTAIQIMSRAQTAAVTKTTPSVGMCCSSQNWYTIAATLRPPATRAIAIPKGLSPHRFLRNPEETFSRKQM